MFDIYRETAPSPVEREMFRAALEQVSSYSTWMEMPGLWWHDSQQYVVDWAITDRGYLESLWIRAKHESFSSMEEHEQKMQAVYDRQADHIAYITGVRIKLIKQHEDKPVKRFSLDQVKQELNPVTYDFPEMKAAEDFIVKMRKRKRSDMWHVRHELEHSLHKVSFWVSDDGFPLPDLMEEYTLLCMAYAGVFDATEAEVEHAMALLGKAFMKLPLWASNGFDAHGE